MTQNTSITSYFNKVGSSFSHFGLHTLSFGLHILVRLHCDNYAQYGLSYSDQIWYGNTWRGAPPDPAALVSQPINVGQFFRPTFNSRTRRRINFCHTFSQFHKVNTSFSLFWDNVLP